MARVSLPGELRTDRLLLRRWVAADREVFAALNADPRVTRYLPSPLDRYDSDALADRIERHFDHHGFGPWALEIPGVVRFAGYVGLSIPAFHASFTPCVEVGWRLAFDHWGCGYATEAARRALACGFDVLGLNEIVSFTATHNLRSRHVMERIGMRRNPQEDFDHPQVSGDLQRHVLYRISAPGR